MSKRTEEIIKVTVLDIYTSVYERYNVKIGKSTVSCFFLSPPIISMDLSMFTFTRVANREPTSLFISWSYMGKEY